MMFTVVEVRVGRGVVLVTSGRVLLDAAGVVTVQTPGGVVT